MSQASKSAYYKALKAQGVKFDRHYRDYSTDELKAAYDQLAEARGLPAVVETPAPADAPPANDELAQLREQIERLTRIVASNVMQQPPPPQAPEPPAAPGPVLDPTQHAGVTLNTHGDDEPIRIDELGNAWYRNEVAKPGYPKPRGRRVLRDMAADTVKETIRVGDYTETFEIPGDPSHAKPIEIKVTLPSFQTGLYKPRNMPFRIHTYQGNRAFDWDDVNKFYGGADLVPASIKHVYVSSDLCYDITTTIRAIEDEYRERVLKTGVTR